MLKSVKQSEIDDYKSQILELRVELIRAQNDAALYKAAAVVDARRANELEKELRVEKRRRKLAEASVKALEDHLRILNETKK